MSSTSEPQNEDGSAEGGSVNPPAPRTTPTDPLSHGLSGEGAASVIPHLERLKKAQVRPPEPPASPAAPKKGDGARKKGAGPAGESGGQDADGA